MHPYERLTAWQKAHEFTVATLQVIERQLRMGDKVLSNQLRRAAISVSANIVEGSGRSSAAQFAAFLAISLGSARECAYLIRLAADLKMIRLSDRATLEARCDQVCRMIVPLMRHLKTVDQRRPQPSRASRASRTARDSRNSSPSSAAYD
ncbi:MAG: four helix bundle protein [Cytophagaceae bacterium]|nr:four helix bundle protein [Gemmatimonadaceae bacterium]